MAERTVLGDEVDGPIFFYREFEEPYGFLSQWFDSPFEHGGITYLTTEMWMMHQKAVLFGDEETAAKILEATTPAEHKALGRQVKNFDGKIWNENRSRIVEEGNYWKFSNNKAAAQIKKKLLETGDRELVEASPSDRIWGVGFNARIAEANRMHWGYNLLGKAIMAVRDKIGKEG